MVLCPDSICFCQQDMPLERTLGQPPVVWRRFLLNLYLEFLMHVNLSAEFPTKFQWNFSGGKLEGAPGGQQYSNAGSTPSAACPLLRVASCSLERGPRGPSDQPTPSRPLVTVRAANVCLPGIN